MKSDFFFVLLTYVNMNIARLLAEQADQGKCLRVSLLKEGRLSRLQNFLIWERVMCRDQMF
jgi:hypothetical protein